MIGHLKGTQIPIPLWVNGESPESEPESVTIVRWIHPLPINEEIAFEEFARNNRRDAP